MHSTSQESTERGESGTGNLPRTKRRLRLGIATALTAVTLAGMLGLVVPAQADELHDKAAALEQQARDVENSLEFVDAGIAKSAADLVRFQGQLPGAQASLADAQTKVGAATAKVDSLASRIDLAQESKDKITSQIALDTKKAAETKSMIGQIAAQSYKGGGISPNLALVLGIGSPGDLANSIDMAGQALRSQNAALEQLTSQKATNQNAQARLAAVEAEIRDLKTQADAALAAEQSARDQAAAQKATVDKLIGDSATINAQLEAQKPQIQAKMKAVQQQQNDVAGQIAEQQRRELAAAAAEAERLAREQAAAGGGGGGGPYVPPAPGNPSAFGLRHPFAGNIPITSGFGWRATPPGTIDFEGTGGYMHTGVDFGAACGTPVYAAAAGNVVIGGWTNGGGGYTVQISHGVVQGNALTTIYYHNSAALVSPGQRVSQGQLIAYSGSTGNSTGCHAHFETWLNGRAVDPMGLL